MRIRLACAGCLVVCCLVVLASGVAWAQPAAGETPAASTPAPGSFAEQFGEWKKLLTRLREIQTSYQAAKPEEKPALEKEFNELLAKGEGLAPKLVEAASAALAKPEESKDAGGFLAAVAQGDLKGDRYESAYKLGKLLIDNKFQSPGLHDMAGTAAFEVMKLDDAETYLKAAEADNTLSESGRRYLADLPKYRELWKKEQEIRNAEKKADDLPRVLLKTNKGDVTIELFENEAPNTVANFISLVEKKYYDGLSFHRVLPGFMAQGGCPKGDGTGGPEYNIPCECYTDNHRVHFRGSLSMAHAGKDTGGSQFFLTFHPTSHLDGKHTVFGRVVEGFDVLGKLQRRDPNDAGAPAADKIVEAKVLRKRPHEYKVTKTGG